MKKYVVKNIQCGLSGNGLSADTVNAEVEFQAESGESLFISEVEFEGFPHIFKTSESVYNKLMNRGAESEEAADEMDDDELEELEVALIHDLTDNYCLYSGDSYDDFFDDQECGGELRDAMRLIVYIVRSEWKEIDRCKKEWIGKTLGDIEIPKCDAEEEWEEG